jgi:hypothetical protein
LLLRWEGQGSRLRIASLVQALASHPHFVGDRSPCFHSAGQRLPATLLLPSKTRGFELRDAICALHGPLVLTIDARRTTIRTIELASDRSAETWRAHVDAREEHQCCCLGLASDRGLGLVAGYHAACDMAVWGAD